MIYYQFCQLCPFVSDCSVTWLIWLDILSRHFYLGALNLSFDLYWARSKYIWSLILFDKINLAEDNIYKDWPRALEKKPLVSKQNWSNIKLCSDFMGQYILWPSSNMMLRTVGVPFHCKAKLLSFVQVNVWLCHIIIIAITMMFLCEAMLLSFVQGNVWPGSMPVPLFPQYMRGVYMFRKQPFLCLWTKLSLHSSWFDMKESCKTVGVPL